MCSRQVVVVWVVLGLAFLPLLFIIHELVGIYQLDNRPLPQLESPRQIDLKVISQDHGTAERQALLRELQFDLVGEIKGGSSKGGRGLLTCRDIDRIEKKEHIGRGVTKDVYRGVHDGRSVALKMVTDKVDDIKSCWRRNKYRHRSECYVYANYKLIKEMSMTLQLDHPNIVKGLGLCIRNNDTRIGSHGVISVYELGDKTASSTLRRLPWDTRLDMSLEILDLLDYMEHSPIGSLAVWDFKTRQFTVVQGRMKLIDLDDVSAHEIPCEKHSDCNVEADTDTGRETIVANSSGLVPCVNSTCYGLNAKFNVISAAKGLLGGALLSSPPPFVQHRVDTLITRARQGNISAKEMKQSLHQLTSIRRRNSTNIRSI